MAGKPAGARVEVTAAEGTEHKGRVVVDGSEWAGTVAGGLLFVTVAVVLVRFAWSLKRSPRDE